jgi:serine/threonine-protein kinase
MGFLDTYKIKRAIHALLSAQEDQAPAVIQAVKLIQGYGPSAIPQLLEACAKTRNPEPFIKLLKTFVQDKTLPLFGKGLASKNSRVVAAVVEVLSQSKAYDPNLLFTWLANPQISVAAIERLLNVHQHAISPKVLLHRVDKLSPQERPMLLRLLSQIATAADVPALMQRLESADNNVRLTCAQTLVRFPSEGMRAAFYKLVSDPYPMLRIAALDGLESLQLPLDLKLICKLLRDENDGVRRELKKFLARGKDPQLANSLFEILEDPSATDIYADAADLLGTIRDASRVQNAVTIRPHATITRDILLRLLKAPQTKTRQVALVGLIAVKTPFDIEHVCPLLWDADFQIRRHAVAILTQYKVPQTLQTLLRALKDDLAEVRQGAIATLNVIVNTYILKELLLAVRGEEDHIADSVVHTLGHQGGPQLIHTALQLLADTNAFLRDKVHKILQLTEEPTMVPCLAEVLTDGEPWARRCAMDVLGMLGGKGRDAVPALLERAQTDEEESVLALEVLMKIGDPRAVPVCLTHMQNGTLAQRKAALQALAELTGAANFDVVLDSMLVLRETMVVDLKEHFNHAAARLLKRFPAHMLRKPIKGAMLHEPTQVLEAREPADSARPASSLYIQGKHDALVIDPAAMAPGVVLGERYQIIRQVGKGGFGVVVLVKDLIVKEEVILKFLYPRLATDELMIQRFIQELRSARRITHENVIRIHDLLPIDNAYAISMEYFPSHNLSVEVSEKKFLSDPLSGCQVLVSICRGMSTAHQAGIIHRDLKPPNILLNDAGLVKVADFGLAAMVTEKSTKLTSPGMMLGTPLYMAPEQIHNTSLDTRADIYSLGVIMYEMFTGVTPYTGVDPVSILFQHVEGKAVPPCTLNPHIPPALEAIILTAMAVDPDQRFQSMEAFEQSLIPLLS